MRDNGRPNAGWKLEDKHYLRKYDNASAEPELQIFDEEDFEDEDKERREYWCVLCLEVRLPEKHGYVVLFSMCTAL